MLAGVHTWTSATTFMREASNRPWILLLQVRFMNVYYWAAHMTSTVGTLLLVFFLRSSMYQVRLCGRSTFIHGDMQL